MLRYSCLLFIGLAPVRAGAALALSADGITVYDIVNSVTWLADASGSMN
jgi:hypothetical protein